MKLQSSEFVNKALKLYNVLGLQLSLIGSQDLLHRKTELLWKTKYILGGLSLAARMPVRNPECDSC